MEPISHIRTLIENNDHQEALVAMKALTKERSQLDQISILNRELKEVKNREISNITSFENIRQEYNALSMRMLILANQLEGEDKATVEQADLTILAEEEEGDLMPASPSKRSEETTDSTTASSNRNWLYPVSFLLLLLIGWGVSQAVGGTEEIEPKEEKKQNVQDLPKPQVPAPSFIKDKTSIRESLGVNKDLIPATNYTTAGGKVDVLVGIYSGTMKGQNRSLTVFDAELTKKVANAIGDTKEYSVSAVALTGAFHGSFVRPLWTAGKVNEITMDTKRGNILLLADWRTNSDEARELVYSLYDLRTQKQLRKNRLENKEGALLKISLEGSLVSALKATVSN